MDPTGDDAGDHNVRVEMEALDNFDGHVEHSPESSPKSVQKTCRHVIRNFTPS